MSCTVHNRTVHVGRKREKVVTHYAVYNYSTSQVDLTCLTHISTLIIGVHPSYSHSQWPLYYLCYLRFILALSQLKSQVEFSLVTCESKIISIKPHLPLLVWQEWTLVLLFPILSDQKVFSFFFSLSHDDDTWHYLLRRFH